jgi:heat shock protein HtpX
MMFDEHIRRNKAATVRLFIILFVILWALVFAIGVVLGYPPIIVGPLALIFGLVYIAAASNAGVDTILRASRARPANPAIREEKLLLHRAEEMAIAAGIPMPKVYVMDSDDINAFAAGPKPEESVIAFTRGALQKLNQEELQGVMGHEMAHIANYDIRVQTYAVALIGIIAMIGEMVWWSLILGGGRSGRGGGKSHPIMILVAIALIILAPLLSRLVYLALSRKREYLADATGAAFTRNPEGLASALEKIAGEKPSQPPSSKTVAGLYLSNPFKRVRRQNAFSTHPPLEDRIRRLRGSS